MTEIRGFEFLHYTVGIHVVKVIIGEEDTWIELLKI